MSNILEEHQLGLAEAAKVAGVSPHSVKRWMFEGRRGTHLEYLRLGRKLVTSREAIERFGRRLAELDRRPANAALRPLPRRNAQMERRAQELGI